MLYFGKFTFGFHDVKPKKIAKKRRKTSEILPFAELIEPAVVWRKKFWQVIISE